SSGERDTRDRSGKHAHLPAMRLPQGGSHADGCVPVLLRMHPLQDAAQAERGRLLRILFLRVAQMPADPGTGVLLRVTARPSCRALVRCAGSWPRALINRMKAASRRGIMCPMRRSRSFAAVFAIVAFLFAQAT